MSATDQLDRGITLINVFTVTPEKQNTAADKIAHIYKTFVCNQPGFISAKIQKSLDGTEVAAVAHWKSQAALSTMQQKPDFQHLLEILDGEIIGAKPRVYEVTASINRSSRLL